jgi:NAD(P)H dehydrogenase (quinone)
LIRDLGRIPPVPGAEIVRFSGYRDRLSMKRALLGAHTLFLVSARESPNRVAEHISAVNAALEAGIRRIVYVSFLGAAADATFTFARDHYATEQYIRKTGLDFTFLRDSLYLDFLPGMASAAGVIAGPAGDGKVACVARDDVADVAAAVLQSGEHAGKTYDLTGPESRGLAYVAEQLTRFSGRPVSYKNETLVEAYASRASYGAPQFEVDGWVTSYAAIASGELDVVSDDIPSILGRPAMTLPDFLAREPDSYRHLLPDARSQSPRPAD